MAAEHSVYEVVPFADMEYCEDDAMYYYQCPCGDLFELSEDQIARGEDIARCPSCSLTIKVTGIMKEGDTPSDANVPS